MEQAKSAEGISFLLDFWKEKYLSEYVSAGGSKVKFVTGRPGAGKSYYLRKLCQAAAEENYIVVSLSAGEVWLHDFREFFLAVMREINVDTLMQGCAGEVIRQMGHDAEEIPDGMSFMDYLSATGQGDPMTRRELRTQIRNIFLDNPLLDNNFAMACSLLTGGILGHPVLENASRDLILEWLDGDKSAKLNLLRTVGINAKISKYNARHMLRSLAEVIRISGHAGLLITVDDLDILQQKAGNEYVRYTKVRRDDTYESIRQLIDEIDSLHNIMIVYGFDRNMIDNEREGLKSYQALWMRIQNEVLSERFNRFVDIADLDRLAIQEYTPEYLVRMSSEMTINGGEPVSLTEAEEILVQSRFGGIGVPELVRLASVKKEN